MLFYVSVLHQITTEFCEYKYHCRCSMSLFYIKSQRLRAASYRQTVVLCLCSTSNHNHPTASDYMRALFYVSVLHQITTVLVSSQKTPRLFYVSVLHQITTRCKLILSVMGCSMSLFYIKSQRQSGSWQQRSVVLCLCSTSNHNSTTEPSCCRRLFYVSVLHQITTRQCCFRPDGLLFYVSVLHQITTNIYGDFATLGLFYVSVLHQITTVWRSGRGWPSLFYVSVLHQITTKSCRY